MKKINRFNAMALAFAIFIFIVGMSFIWMGGQISRLACIRLESRQVECELQRHFLGFVPTGRQRLPQVTGSELKEDCLDGCRYWIELLTGGEPVRLTAFSSYNRSGVRADQERLEAFLSSNDVKSFEHVGSPSWALLVCSVPLILAGGFLAISYSKRLHKT